VGFNYYLDCIIYFWNFLFEKQYPNIKFVKPGETVDGLYAMYKLGFFITNNEFDLNRNNFVPNSQPLQKVATDILGLEYKEIKPKIKKFNPFKSKKPYITIATHSTAQTKYWNNPTGWQELVDYVKSKGYDVYLLSKEEDGYMGNKNPEGVIQIQNKSLEEIGSLLLGSECFVGISSGLSWYAWALEVPSILISGFTDEDLEMKTDVVRIINKDVCNGCWAKHMFDKGDWNWCPEYKGTERQFECTKSITFNMVERYLEEIIKNNED
jgi:autotransporter strand-loop-strand O-heptosyltransferase